MFVLTIISFIVTPIIRAKLNHQFMLGARNQAFSQNMYQVWKR
jgi:ATP-binding cassette, subfamily B, bacterial HlyB/CyaB